ncbi:MAG: PaaI family thioesterase [Desulfuromonadales bacterium]|nr:PaaI family thioesterase [Desulfuromonadales bacterium]
MENQEHFRKLERMYASAPINEFYKPNLEISEGEAVLEFAVQKKFFHAAGAIHGSVYFKALDDAAYFAANSLIEDVFVLTSNFNIYLLRPVSSGRIRAVGRVVNQTKKLLIAEAILYDEQGREVARGSGSFMHSQMALTEEIGYC